MKYKTLMYPLNSYHADHSMPEHENAKMNYHDKFKSLTPSTFHPIFSFVDTSATQSLRSFYGDRTVLCPRIIVPCSFYDAENNCMVVDVFPTPTREKRVGRTDRRARARSFRRVWRALNRDTASPGSSRNVLKKGLGEGTRATRGDKRTEKKRRKNRIFQLVFISYINDDARLRCATKINDTPPLKDPSPSPAHPSVRYIIT